MKHSLGILDSQKIDAFLKNTTLIEYSQEDFNKSSFNSIDNFVIATKKKSVQWFNVYGLQHQEAIRKVIHQNNLDDFLVNLILEDEHRNKVIELENSIFLSFKIVHYKNANFQFEQMLFMVSPHFVWSIQEKSGDYFQHIRSRIFENKGVVRKKNAAYLLYLLIEAIIDNYYNAYEKLIEKSEEFTELTKVKPSPEFAIYIENTKQNLFILKKAISSLREAISKIEKLEINNFETHYFTELKEQANYMIDDIDFDLQQFESSINLMFNIQSHRLNEVMKTLTIISVIFIPLTFLAGIYGMNFNYIPELNYHYGYFAVIGVMVLIVLLSLYYFKKNKWFN